MNWSRAGGQGNWWGTGHLERERETDREGKGQREDGI